MGQYGRQVSPIVLKGIINAEDVQRAEQYGANAIWVSIHGGR